MNHKELFDYLLDCFQKELSNDNINYYKTYKSTKGFIYRLCGEPFGLGHLFGNHEYHPFLEGNSISYIFHYSLEERVHCVSCDPFDMKSVECYCDQKFRQKNNSVRSIKSLKNRIEHYLASLTEIQLIHSFSEPENWEHNFKNIAAKHNLD
jgi:hypothetical protein